MLITDPIADMLTRIRNALTAKHEDVLVPASDNMTPFFIIHSFSHSQKYRHGSQRVG